MIGVSIMEGIILAREKSVKTKIPSIKNEADFVRGSTKSLMSMPKGGHTLRRAEWHT